MSVSYKEFNTKKEEVLKEYKTYYYNKFIENFHEYYNDWSNDKKMILFAVRHKHLKSKVILFRGFAPDNNTLYLESTEQYYFAASVFYMCLIPQVMQRVLGDMAKRNMHAASGWPNMSAGLGGNVSAEQWLKESDLNPEVGEADYFNSLLEIILPFHCSEIADFLNITSESIDIEAHKSLCIAAKGKVDCVLNEIVVATRNSEKIFQKGNGEYPVYYLTKEELQNS